MEVSTRPVAPIEKWMAMRKARATSTNVKRCLFAVTAEDRKRTAEHIATMTALTDLNAKRTYNFDFAEDTPLEGRFQWERVESAPMPYNSRLNPTARNLPAATTCTISPLSRTAVDLCSPPRGGGCDMTDADSQDTTPVRIHDSGVFSDQDSTCCSEDEENAATSPSSPASSPTPRTSSPQQPSPRRKRTIPDYFRQRKSRVTRVKRLQ